MRRSSQSPNEHAQARVSPLASNLARWAVQSPREFNRRAVIWTALTMLLVLMLSRHDPRQASFVRNVAMIGIGVHGALHWTLVRALSRLRDGGLVEASAALRAYLSPYRITYVDLAVAWAGLAAAVSLFRVFVPVTPIAGG